MKQALIILCVLVVSVRAVLASQDSSFFSLSEVTEYALQHNPEVIKAQSDLDIGDFNVAIARAERLPTIDLLSNATHSRFQSPITPITGSPLEGSGFPEFDDTIYDFGLSFTLPIYRGGALPRQLTIEKMKKSAAEDRYALNRQELIYNVTSVFNKILQLEKLSGANEAAVRQLEAHKQNVELFLQAGTVPNVELLKTEAELAHARQAAIMVKNSIESSYELLKMLMGFDELDKEISVLDNRGLQWIYPSRNESLEQALLRRPDYRNVLTMLEIAEQRVGLASGKRLPSVSLNGEYMERAGGDLDFRENWALALRLSVPLYDGGTVRAEISRTKKELEKTREDERMLRHAVIREVKDAYITIDNVRERIYVSLKAIETAKEILRVERLKYETGAGTGTDVIDAQSALLRAETDYYQAVFDNNIAVASLRKAIGDDGVLVKEVLK